MTVEELLVTPYLWSADHSSAVLTIAAAFPVVATVTALLLRGGKTDRDGLAVADLAVGAALVVFAVSSLFYAAASLSLDLSILDMQVAVLIAPLICCVGTLFGVSRVFKLRRLNAIGLLQDVGLFLGLLWCARWFMGKFYGWGIVFFGGVGALFLFLAIGLLALLILFRRMFRRRSRK